MQRRKTIRWAGPLALLATTTLVAAGCSGPGNGGEAAPASGASASTSGDTGSSIPTQSPGPQIDVPQGDEVGVSFTKTANNPFFIALNNAAEAQAKKDNVKLTLSSGKADGDADSQVQAIENAIARGDKGILITTNGPGVTPALQKAKAAGLVIIALDTPLETDGVADMTFASNNLTAGTLIGKWAAGTLNGQAANMAMLDLFNDKIVSVDIARDQGFLTGMGIGLGDPQKNGDEAKSSKYTGGKGGTYSIACNEPTTGSNDGGRTAMERCLTRDPDINVMYSINEPAGEGGAAALQAAGKTAIKVSVDGGCGGIKDISDGVLDATALQYPSRMAAYGVDTVAAIARGGKAPAYSPGLNYFDTGLTLVTDKPVSGVESVTSAEAQKFCWGG